MNVVFVIPYYGENALRYLRAFAELPGIRLGVISQADADSLPADIKARVRGHFRVDDCMDGEKLGAAAKAMVAHFGRVDRLVGMLEQLQQPLADARAIARIGGMTPEIAKRFRDKDEMKRVLRDAGLPVARSRRIEHPDHLRQLIAEVGFPVVVKPTAGLGARATFRVNNLAEMEDALNQIRPSPGNAWQAEEFVTGEENTFETVSIRGEPVWWSGTHYRPGPLTVVENPWIQYTVLLPAEADHPDFVRFAPINFAALRALGMDTGLTHMEWFKRKDGSMVISEVGARPPGVHIMPLMSHAHNTDMIKAWARLMAFGEFEPPRRVRSAGAAFFRGQGNGDRVVDIHGIDRAQQEVGKYVIDRQLPKIGQPRASGYEGEGWAIARHERTDVVAHTLQRLVSLVRVELG
jgi:biotin carboxylase